MKFMKKMCFSHRFTQMLTDLKRKSLLYLKSHGDHEGKRRKPKGMRYTSEAFVDFLELISKFGFSLEIKAKPGINPQAYSRMSRI